MTVIKFKKLRPDAVIPRYAHDTDAGMDLVTIHGWVLLPGERYLMMTGLSIQLPYGTEAQVRPRSGLALKHGVTVLNSPGTIDQGYTGEIGVILINHGEETFSIFPGDRIAQLVIAPVLRASIKDVSELDDSDRGDRGFGSTGSRVVWV